MMKIKTSTRISIIFSIFTFFIIFIMLILLNVLSFLGWYNEERNEVIIEINNEYNEILEDFSDFNVQEKELLEDIEELNGFISSSNNTHFDLAYKKLFLELYQKDDSFFIIHEKETKFGSIFLPYDISSHFYTQIRLIKIGLVLLIVFTLLSFIISKYLFTRLALKDIFYISNKLKNIDLNNIDKIKLDLNRNDEINVIVDSINNFLGVIDNNTKSLKQFNSQVSHEFKTPLMIISSELEYLTLSGNKNSDYTKIEKQIDILNNLLETFLFISKIENFKGDIKKDDINISKIINDKIKNLSIIYKDKNIKIIENVNKKVKLKTNKKLLELLIKNILDNAFKYNKSGGNIKITLDNEYLLIRDSGIGISKEHLYKIFDSFYRVNSKEIGYGIGLNIVKKITNILGHKFEIKSEINIGTEFKIIF